MNPLRSARALAVASAVLAMTMIGAPPTRADGASGGAAEIVSPSTNEALRAGGSATVWAIKLPKPPDSNCSGDSAHDAHYVYAYLASTSLDPAKLTFNPDSGLDSPAGQVAYPLIDSSGSPYISRATAPDTGQVLPGTGFTFRRVSIGRTTPMKVPAGEYNVGMACWDAEKSSGDRYWNTVVTFSADAGDPNGLAWRVGSGAESDSSGSSPWVVILVVVLLVGAAGAGIAFQRKRTA